jgi:hypothetical protein
MVQTPRRREHWSFRFRMVSATLVLFLFLVLVSCQTFPRGEPIETITGEPGYAIADLDRYFAMGRSAWREREIYGYTGWRLLYFGDEDTHIMAVAILGESVVTEGPDWYAPAGLMDRTEAAVGAIPSRMPATEEGTLFFAFRGSQLHRHLRDTRMTLMIVRRRVPFVDDDRITAHGGFLRKYLAVRATVHELIAEHEPNRVVIVGHSAGGALASLAYMDLLPRYPDLEIKAVTFGMPRVYNRHGAAWFARQDEHFLRIVQGRDLVVGIPPALFGYRHAGRLVRFGRRSPILPVSLRDHWPGYQDELAALLAEEP